MRVLRSIYFWMALGTLWFVGVAAWSSPRSGLPYGLPAFFAGFVTACGVGLFWYAVYVQMHPTASDVRDKYKEERRPD
jgi:hypothetical protein